MMILQDARGALFSVLLAAMTAQSVEIGETVCVEGIVMDYYCIARGTLLDNPSIRTLEGAEQHSVHCLVDVPECITSPFEVLVDPHNDEPMYTRGWRLDDDTRAVVLELGQSVRNEISQGLRVALDATVLQAGTSTDPPIVSGANVRVSNLLADACGTMSTSDGDSSPTEAPTPMSPVGVPMVGDPSSDTTLMPADESSSGGEIPDVSPSPAADSETVDESGGSMPVAGEGTADNSPSVDSGSSNGETSSAYGCSEYRRLKPYFWIGMFMF
jgi:hypothetical protein